MEKKVDDIFQKLFDYMADDLSQINEADNKNLLKTNQEVEEKYVMLNNELKKLNDEKAKSMFEKFSAYIDSLDYLNGYFNQKYFIERIKNRYKNSSTSNKIAGGQKLPSF